MASHGPPFAVPWRRMQDALSPLDGRYAESMAGLRECFGEAALIRARAEVEVRYLVALGREPRIREFPRLTRAQEKRLFAFLDRFGQKDVRAVKRIERTTNHDVKALEEYLRKVIGVMPGMRRRMEFIHFALTSEDVNNLAYGLLIHRALTTVLLPAHRSLLAALTGLAKKGAKTPLLSLTHGQPATPTTLGAQVLVFVERLERQIASLRAFRMHGKLGGAVGNFSAHRAAYPGVRWDSFRDRFVKGLGLIPLRHTTQINPHDDLAELSHFFCRLNAILLDFSRDVWFYISRGIFRQAAIPGEVGSSTMPHKVNPIDFENAEGNLGLSTSLFSHFAEKLPVSRLQRDLSDSTVQRNLGVAFGYHLLAVFSLQNGLRKLSIDASRAREELVAHPEVHAEAIQTVLRKHRVAGAYDRLKALTRGRDVTLANLRDFVAATPLPKAAKEHLMAILRLP